MKYCILFASFLGSVVLFSQGFMIKNQTPLYYSGSGDGLRTIWFSNDNKTVYGDFNHIVAWNIKSQKLLFKNKIDGRPAYPSATNSQQTQWVQGGGGYNNPDKPKIEDMYSAISISNLAENNIELYRLNGFSISNIAFVKNKNQIVAITTNSKTYINSAVLFDLTSQKIIKSFVLGASSNDVMTQICMSDDSKYLGVGYAGKQPRFEVYDFETEKFIKSFNTDFEVAGIEMHNKTLAAAGGNSVIVVNLITMEIKKSITTIASVFHMALSPNGKSIAVGSFSTGADIIDVESGDVNHFTDALTNCLAFSPNGNILGIGYYVTFHTPEVTACELWFNENPHQISQPAEGIIAPKQ